MTVPQRLADLGVTEEEYAAQVADAQAQAAAAEAAYIAEQERKAAALSTLNDPLTVPTITGTTVAAVRTSASQAVASLAQQMQDRLAAVADVIPTE